jgi:diguanylate cyclase (GGDEF)-like protein
MDSPDLTDNDYKAYRHTGPKALAAMGSFKFKLVLWFALLALLPLAVAFYGYDALARRSETRRVDAALQAGLRGAVAGYGARLDAAARSATALATDPALQRALRGGDKATVRRVLSRVPNAHLGGGPGSVAVLDGGRVLGRISVSVPVNDRLLAPLGGALEQGDRLVGVKDGRIVAGGGGPLVLGPGQAARVHVGGVEYRGLQTSDLHVPPGFALVALAPQHGIDEAATRSERRIAFALLSSLIILGAVTYLVGRSITRTLRHFADAANAIAFGRFGQRVEVRGSDEFAELGNAFNRMASQLEQRLAELETERSRVRDATARFGEAMVATHDPAQLVRVVVESAVEATGAVGGVVIGPEGELARVGDPNAAGERIAFPLRVGSSDFGSLVLSCESFDADQVETAASLAAQVVVALENARLHRIVERQALVDSLTGLANRRSFEATLRAELARAARFGDSVSVVFADLDDFKQVNDRHGHAAGDEVLKAFAAALQRTVRESDVAGRWGGEEFALVLPGTDIEGGARLAERARATIESHELQMPNGEQLSVTASFGVAAYPESHELGELLAAADSALYAAKREGKNRVVASAESLENKIV